MAKTSQRFGEWYQGREPVIWFVLRFGFFMAVFYGLLLIPAVDRVVYGYLVANAWISNAILDLLGFATRVDGTLIASADFSIAVRRGCDGLEPAALVISALLAFPAPWTRKIAGILVGTAVLLLLNILRIVSLFWIGSVSRPIFAKAHLEIWPLLFILAAFVICWGWVRWVQQPGK